MTINQKWPKKVKAQLPYELYCWIKKMADCRRVPVSIILHEIVNESVKRPDIYERRLMDWSEAVRGDSPNNVHFMADMRMMERFEYFKLMNHTAVDSVAIRAMVNNAHVTANRRIQVGDELQGVLF